MDWRVLFVIQQGYYRTRVGQLNVIRPGNGVKSGTLGENEGRRPNRKQQLPELGFGFCVKAEDAQSVQNGPEKSFPIELCNVLKLPVM